MEHKIGLVYFAPEEGADMCMKGLFDGLKEQGIEEAINLEIRRAHAQAEIANIPQLIQNYDGSDVDVIVAMTTPVLSAAAAMAGLSRLCSPMYRTRLRGRRQEPDGSSAAHHWRLLVSAGREHGGHDRAAGAGIRSVGSLTTPQKPTPSRW